jgi:hypothetical protein
VLIVAPLATHVALVATWWLALRWLSEPIDGWLGAAAAWILLAPLAKVFWTRSPPVNRGDLLVRVPAAGFFFVLLALRGSDVLPLVAYAIAFAPPYLALFRRGSATAPV